MSDRTDHKLWAELERLREENSVLKEIVASSQVPFPRQLLEDQANFSATPGSVLPISVEFPVAREATPLYSVSDSAYPLPSSLTTEGLSEQILSIVPVQTREELNQYVQGVSERKRAEGALRYLMAGAHCLLWYADAFESDEGDIRFYTHIPDEGAAQRFFAVDIPQGSSYFKAWYWTRVEEDRLRSDNHGVGEIRAGRSYRQEFRCRRADGEIRWLAEHVSVEVQGPKNWRLVGVCTDITELKNAEESLQRSEERFRALIEDGSDVLTIVDRANIIRYQSPSSQRILGYRPQEMLGNNVLAYLHSDDSGQLAQALQTCTEIPGDGVSVEVRMHHKSGSWRFVEIVVRNMQDKPGVDGMVLTMRDVTERKNAQELIQVQFDRLKALRAIETVIATSLDLRLTLHFFLDQVVTLLQVSAADVLLFNGRTHMLEYTAGWGFRSANTTRPSLRLGQGQAGIAGLERRSLYFTDLGANLVDFIPARLFEEEGFVSYAAIPLVAKGNVVGVLELYHRSAITPTAEWRDFAETLAGEAAIAIDNATLFDNLQRSNAELTLAYDATIEGWSRALDLRDKETEGHSQRVTDMTLRLAQTLMVDDYTLRYMRYGALLHDIGKMGIPDSILLKPGELDDEEWKIMRRHPTYAYEMLAPIAFLRPALDIPYCHHEKWDGTGYPRGLKGKEIPLAARIFSVIDVWDALCSDRPYRLGWSEDRVRDYIQAQAGTHLDPDIVNVFLSMDW